MTRVQSHRAPARLALLVLYVGALGALGAGSLGAGVGGGSAEWRERVALELRDEGPGWWVGQTVLEGRVADVDLLCGCGAPAPCRGFVAVERSGDPDDDWPAALYELELSAERAELALVARWEGEAEPDPARDPQRVRWIHRGSPTPSGGCSRRALVARGEALWRVDAAKESVAPVDVGALLGGAEPPAVSTLPEPRDGHLVAVRGAELRLVDLESGAVRGPLVVPVAVRRLPEGLRFQSPGARWLRWTDTDGVAREQLLVGPQEVDLLRLRTLQFATGQVAEPVESWSRLPGPEHVLDSRYVALSGAPHLAVVTRRGDKVGMLERKKLRVFRLAADRTRAGNEPLLDVKTRSRLWQRLDFRFAEVDGDRVIDLVLVQPEGLGGEQLVVDVHRGTGDWHAGRGHFESRSSTSVLPSAVPWLLRSDQSGDGTPDLWLLYGDRLEALTLDPSPRRKSSVVEAPVLSVALGAPGDAAGRRLSEAGHGVAVTEDASDGAPSRLVVVARSE